MHKYVVMQMNETDGNVAHISTEIRAEAEGERIPGFRERPITALRRIRWRERNSNALGVAMAINYLHPP